jgi:chaperone required for assembly of F1-ATPase
MRAVLMTDETEDQRWQRLSQDKVKRSLPKRFYKLASVGEGNAILLDGRAVKTPMKAQLKLPSAALARAVAAEWQAQQVEIDPAQMPLTKLANTAIDRVGAERPHVAGEVVAFAGNDLVCYRAEEPAELVALQNRQWNPVIDWAFRALNAKFIFTRGISHVAQPAEALREVEAAVVGLDDFTLTATHNVMTLTGSALLALMLQSRAIDADAAWAAAHVDEDFQISQWGLDYEAEDRRALRLAEYRATCRFLNLLSGH